MAKLEGGTTLRRWGHGLADGLAACLALHYGFTGLPGSGAYRAPPRLHGSQFNTKVRAQSPLPNCIGKHHP